MVARYVARSSGSSPCLTASRAEVSSSAAATRAAIPGFGQGVRDALDAGLRAEVGGRRVAGVDGEELPLDVGSEVIHEVRTGYGRRVVAERRALDRPLEERLHGHVDAAAFGLTGHDAIHRGVGEDRARLQGDPGIAGEGDDLVAEQVGGVDRVLARHDLQRRGCRVAQAEARDDVRGDELQDRGADGGRDDVRGRDLVDDDFGVGGAVDGAEAGDHLVGAARAHLVHGVGGGAVDRVDERGRDIREHQVVAALMQEEADEPPPDVPRAEVDGFHDSLTALRMPKSSSVVEAALSRATSSSSEKRMAICDRISRCSSPFPAIPTTNVTGSPSQSTPPS